MVDPWEALQRDYQPTAVVLDHTARELNAASPHHRTPARIMLLGGSDLLETMSQPGVWSFTDLDNIFSTYGVFVIERSGSAVADALAPLMEWSECAGRNWGTNVHIVRQLITNDISSTRIRQFLRQGMSVEYLLPVVVIEYIRAHGLYREYEGFRETRSCSMPPLCRLEGKTKARRQMVGAEGTGWRETVGVDEAIQLDEDMVDRYSGGERGRRSS